MNCKVGRRVGVEYKQRSRTFRLALRSDKKAQKTQERLNSGGNVRGADF